MRGVIKLFLITVSDESSALVHLVIKLTAGTLIASMFL